MSVIRKAIENRTPVNHVKRHAKRIKKKHPYVTLMQVQHDLSVYLGFKKWAELIAAPPELLQKRLEEKPVSRL